jgi:hypothetical protein
MSVYLARVRVDIAYGCTAFCGQASHGIWANWDDQVWSIDGGHEVCVCTCTIYNGSKSRHVQKRQKDIFNDSLID